VLVVAVSDTWQLEHGFSDPRKSKSLSYDLYLALLYPLRVIKRLTKRPEMQREPNSHEDMEDLMRLAPYIEFSGTPCFWQPNLS
jgi:hypothetical protein